MAIDGVIESIERALYRARRQKDLEAHGGHTMEGCVNHRRELGDALGLGNGGYGWDMLKARAKDLLNDRNNHSKRADAAELALAEATRELGLLGIQGVHVEYCHHRKLAFQSTYEDGRGQWVCPDCLNIWIPPMGVPTPTPIAKALPLAAREAKHYADEATRLQEQIASLRSLLDIASRDRDAAYRELRDANAIINDLADRALKRAMQRQAEPAQSHRLIGDLTVLADTKKVGTPTNGHNASCGHCGHRIHLGRCIEPRCACFDGEEFD